MLFLTGQTKLRYNKGNMTPEGFNENTNDAVGEDVETHPDIDDVLAETEEDEALSTEGIEVVEHQKPYEVSDDGKVVTVPDWGGGPPEQHETDAFQDLSTKQKEAGINFLEKDIQETENQELEENLTKERDEFLEQREHGEADLGSENTIESENNLVHQESTLDENNNVAPAEAEKPVSAIEATLNAKLAEAEEHIQEFLDAKREADAETASQEEEKVHDPQTPGEIVPAKEHEVDFEHASPITAGIPEVDKPPAVEQISTPEEMLMEEFGISKERIDTLPGFSNLKEPQKRLVIENLRTAKLGMIQNGADAAFKEQNAEANFVGRIWNGLSKGWKMSKFEQQTKEQIDKGGIDTYGETLTHLIKSAENGPGVEYINGEPVMQFVPEFEGLEPQQAEKIKHFNDIANTYSKIPDEWGYESASKRERKQFEAAKKAYSEAKKDIIELNLIETDGNKQAAREFAFSIDEQVQMSRFLGADVGAETPISRLLGIDKSVEKDLQKIDQPVLWRGFVKTVTDKGANAAKGYVVRAGSAMLLGAGGLILAGGVVGGWMGRKQAGRSLMERDEAQRKGEGDNSAEASNFVEASGQAEKLERLLMRFDAAEDPQKQQKILHSIEARINYTQSKMDDGKMVYGKDAEAIANQVELLKMISMAKAKHAIESEDHEQSEASKSRREKLDKRLATQLNATEAEIQEARKAFKTKGMKRGAAFGLGFALAGNGIREYIFSDDAIAATTTEATEAAQKTGAGMAAATGIESATAGVTEAMPRMHTVASGDNLWNIIKEDLEQSGSLEGLDEAAKLKAIDEIENRFTGASPEKLRELGISSGNAHVIEVGEKINLGAVYDTMDQSFTPSPDAMPAPTPEEAATFVPDQYQEPIEDVPLESEAPVENIADRFDPSAYPPLDDAEAWQELKEKHTAEFIERYNLSEEEARKAAEEIIHGERAKVTHARSAQTVENVGNVQVSGGEGKGVFSTKVTQMPETDKGVQFGTPEQVDTATDSVETPATNEHPSPTEMSPDTAREAHEQAVREALGAASAAETLSDDSGSNIRIINNEAIAGQGGPLPPESGAALTPEHLQTHELTPEQMRQLERQYGRAVDQKVRDIFGSTQGERAALQNERQVDHRVTVKKKEVIREGLRDMLGDDFSNSRIGRNVTRNLEEMAHDATGSPSGDKYKHGLSHEWSGQSRQGIVGIKDYTMAEVLNKNFTKGGDLNYIEQNNRSQLLDYISELMHTVEPRMNETTEQYFLRATAIRNGGVV